MSSANSSFCSLLICVDPPQLSLGDPQLRAGRQLTELAGEASADPWALQRLRTELRLDLRRDPDQMPTQPVDQAVALVHQLIAVITQHPDLMGLLIQERDRQILNAFADRGQRDRSGVDRIGLPRCPDALRDSPVNDGGTRITRSPAPSRARSSRLVTCRQSSTAHTRSGSMPAANRRAFSTPSSLAWIVASRDWRRSPHRAQQACASACARPPRSRSCIPSLR